MNRVAFVLHLFLVSTLQDDFSVELFKLDQQTRRAILVDSEKVFKLGDCHFGPPPPPLQPQDLKCYLYTKQKKKHGVLLDDKKAFSKVKKHLPTKIIIHGWLSSARDFWAHKMKNKYLSRKECQVILCDWSTRSRGPYSHSAIQAQVTGDLLAKFIEELSSRGITLKNVHCIGHSIGAHLCGFAGRNFKKLGKPQVGRITGLDPAGPCFDFPATKGLWHSDASFVDVIHTDSIKFGSSLRRGHLDSYPNYGLVQPGCPHQNYLGSCNHFKACEFFTKSIHFKRKCENQKKIVFGDKAKPKSKGVCKLVFP